MSEDALAALASDNWSDVCRGLDMLAALHDKALWARPSVSRDRDQIMPASPENGSTCLHPIFAAERTPPCFRKTS